MLSPELLKKVKRIEIVARKMVNDVLSGQYKSHFKGQGMQFSDHRTYVQGDDIRHIDWKVSARTRDPQIKKFEEERELTVLLLVDVSASREFGSHKKTKQDMILDLMGMIAYAAAHSGDKVGLVLFSDRVEKIVPPKKGRAHVLRMIRDLMVFNPKGKKTDLNVCLEVALQVLKHHGVIFILSDFMSPDFEKSLKKLASKHDVVSIGTWDPRELELPAVGKVVVRNPETGEEGVVDTQSYAFKEYLKNYRDRLETTQTEWMKKIGVEWLKVSTQEDYAEAVVRFFQKRARS